MVWRSWQSAWQGALYGPDGFYRRSRGPAAHFATSAQGIPGAGALLARAVVALAAQSRCTRVIDVGAGRGELLHEVAAVAPDLHLTGVDVVPRPPQLPGRIGWLVSPGGARLPAELRGLERTLVLAHEWLDVVPCPVVEHDGSVWRLVEVDASGRERLGDAVGGAELLWLQRHWPIEAAAGGRAEVGTTRDAAHRDLRGRIGSGLLVAVDYGHRRGHRPGPGTLTGFRDGAQCAPLPDGSTDLTAHVAVDTLGSDDLLRQREVFARLGIQPADPPLSLAREDPPAYLAGLRERGAHAALTARGGLGDFWWAISAV